MEEIRQEEVETAMNKMKKGKATGADEVRLEMMEMTGEVGVKWTGRLLNVCMQEGRIPREWRMGLIVPIWKRKGDVHEPGKHRGITLLSQVLKLLERVLDARIRRRVEGDFGEEQQGFRKGRGTADGMYVLRQMVEKRLEVQGSMALGFVDLEKAFETVPREMVMATLRWMGVPEADVRMVEGTYEKTTARVVVGEGASKEFEVKIGLRQGSVLSPLLIIAKAWRAVEGVMADRRISKRLKGKVMSTCVTPACLYGTETLALTELQQQRLQVCENNWVRKIARVTRADR